MTSPTTRDTGGSEGTSLPEASQPGLPLAPHPFNNIDSSQIKQGGTRDTKPLPRADSFSSGVTGSPDRVRAFPDGPTLDADRQPLVRMFDPQESPDHRNVPKDLLLGYNRDRGILHLRGYVPSTGTIKTYPGTIVISIDAVAYSDDLAAAVVFFHHKSAWNTVTVARATKDNARLEAFHLALCIINEAKLNGAPFLAAYIRCADLEFCLANANDNPDMGPSTSKLVNRWLQRADQTLLADIKTVAEYVTTSANGFHPMDVYLWCVSSEDMEPVTDMGNAFMYERHNRDWYKESGRDPGRFRVDGPGLPVYKPKTDLVANAKAILNEYLIGFTTHPPADVVLKGAKAVSAWKAEATLNLRHALLTVIVASDGCWLLNQEVRAEGPEAEGGLVNPFKFLHAYGLMEKFTAEKERMLEYIADFVKEQRRIRSTAPADEQQAPDTGLGNNDASEVLAARVVELFEMDRE